MKQYRVVVKSICIVLLLLAFSTRPAGAQTITQIIGASGDGVSPLDNPQSIAVDSSGNVYVIGCNSNNVFKITPNGDTTEVIDSGNGLLSPYGIAVDGEDNIYVSGKSSNNVFKITSGGNLTKIIDYVYHPHGIAVDGSGNIYLAMPEGSFAYKIAPDGVKTVIIDGSGDGNGKILKTPQSIAVDGSGNVYVLGLYSHNVFKISFNQDGTVNTITEIIDSSGDGVNTLSNPWSLTVDGFGNVYVSGHSNNNVFKITPGGVKTLIIDSSHGLKSPRDIAVDGSGNVYVAGNFNSNAFKITPGGDITQIINAAGDNTNPLKYAYGIAVDSFGNVYVSGQASDNVFKITPAGETPVHFDDENLKAKVEATLGVDDPTPTQMLELTCLSANTSQITNLTGLEYATNLTELYLAENQISDISALSGLTKLTRLELYANQISGGIQPLSGLTNLTYLRLHLNQINDISALSNLTKLTWLELHRNQISDIDALSKMIELEWLYLTANKIVDISALSKLTSLTWLRLSNNRIIDISPLSELTNLKVLWLNYNVLNQEAYCRYIPLIKTKNLDLTEFLYPVSPYGPCNTAPLVMITGPASGTVVPVNISIELAGAIDDPDEGDTHDYTWAISSDTWPEDLLIWGTSTDRTISEPISFSEAGIYKIVLTVTDEFGESDTSDTIDGMPAFVVVYDPSAGFVTGGGWIDSPAGAYAADTSLVGKANFGFVSKYQKGATIPTGQTEFVFQAGDLNFHSSSYEWLVVNQGGTNAQFKGSGTINGGGDYKFMLWAGDGSPDTFRIKIWTEDGETENVVYDNGHEGSRYETGQAIGGGSVVIHMK